jgi:hypothetical protein
MRLSHFTQKSGVWHFDHADYTVFLREVLIVARATLCTPLRRHRIRWSSWAWVVRVEKWAYGNQKAARHTTARIEAALARVAQAAQSNGTQLAEVHQTGRSLLTAEQGVSPQACHPAYRAAKG